VIGLISFALAWNPPKLVGLFAQKGVYGIAAASLVPITMGVLINGKIPTWIVGCSAGIGLFGHLFLNIFMGVVNPAVSSTIAMLISLGFSIISLLIVKKKSLIPIKNYV
jgi:SSS family solute:Na+ symporter/sodium/pantothenate symporter